MHGPSDAVAGGLGRLAPPVAEGRPVQEESPEAGNAKNAKKCEEAEDVFESLWLYA